MQSFVDSGAVRIRKVVHRGGLSFRSKVPSLLLNRVVHAESRGERFFVCLLDQDLDVVEFGEQPCRLVFLLDGVRRTHVPDFLVKRMNRVELVEVKPEARIDEFIRRRHAFLEKELASVGISYLLVTDKEIYREPRLGNVMLARRYRSNEISEEHRAFIFEAVASNVVRLGDLCPAVRGSALALIGRRELNTDWWIPLGPESPLLLV